MFVFMLKNNVDLICLYIITKIYTYPQLDVRSVFLGVVIATPIFWNHPNNLSIVTQFVYQLGARATIHGCWGYAMKA
jgi:hypothetical protein